MSKYKEGEQCLDYSIVYLILIAQNGKIDIFEQVIEFEVFNNIMNENDKKTISIDKDFELEDKD